MPSLPESARRLLPLFDFVPHVAAAIAVAVGALTLAGWEFDLAALKSVLPGLTTVKVNAARPSSCQASPCSGWQAAARAACSDSPRKFARVWC